MPSRSLHHWIVVLGCAYMEYTFTPWDGRYHYRRTVDFGLVVWCRSAALDVPTKLRICPTGHAHRAGDRQRLP
ncbi:hypothetical protein [Pandoraea faecigallinarum]|nr:hypothetical protein [Pandoraea faecigallinarum]